MSAQVYWIRAAHHSDITSEGYVGVSKNASKRWAYGHKWAHVKGRHDNPRLSNAIAKYGWDSLVKTVVVVAEEAYCYELEKSLRPAKEIGWNLVPGGNKPPESKPRGPDYVSPLKGISRPTPWLIGKAKPPSKEACIAGGKAGKGRKNTPEHLAKRMESRRITRLARGQIRPFVVNGVQYESSKIAADAVGVPEATLKYWAYGKGKPSSKYAHIVECRWL
jgi:hypothetical protein